MTRSQHLLTVLIGALTIGSVPATAGEQRVFDAKGQTLLLALQQNSYGAPGAPPLIREDPSGPIFQPSSPQDHLTTKFFPLSRNPFHRKTLVLHAAGMQASPVTIRIQRPDFENIAICGAECSITVGFGTRFVRLVMVSKDLTPASLPTSVTLTVENTWDWDLAGIAGIVVVMVLALLLKRRLKKRAA